MLLSVVIVNWNTRQLLEGCLRSVFAGPFSGELEALVVDNRSSDGSREMVRSLFPQVRLLENHENVGFACANNQAIRQCQGSYILLLNPDTELRSGALQTLVDYLEAHPQAGAAGPRLLNPDGTLQESCYPAPTLLREFWRMFHLDRLRPYAVYPMQKWPVDRSREVEVLMGACLLLRREALDQVGLLDEDYFIYSEEVDLCRRVRAAGWQLAWLPQAQVVHYGGQSTMQAAADMFLRLYQGKVLYFRKHHGRLTVQVYKLILAAATLGRLLVTPFALLEKPARRRQHLILSGHYRRLLVSLPGM